MPVSRRIKTLWQSFRHPQGGGLPSYFSLLIGLGVACFGLALAAYAYLGTFSRYYADDYCLTGSFLASGFWRSQIELYLTWSPRFSGAFFLNLSEFFGRSAIQGWTALVIGLWVAALSWAFKQLGALLRPGLPAGLPILLGEALVFFTILEAPQRYQAIFWRIGLITYTLPLVFLALLLGLVAKRVRHAPSTRPAVPWLLGSGMLAFIGGGFSETYVTLQTGLLALALIGAWLLVKGPTRRSVRAMLFAGLIGSLVAFVLVVASPGNAVRLAAMPERPGLLELVRVAVTSAFIFVHASLQEFAFQNLLCLLLALLFTYALFARQLDQPRLRPGPLTWALLLTPLVGGLLILAVCTPSAYAQSSYPEGRVLIEARFLLVAVFLFEGILLGMCLAQLHQWAGEPAQPMLQLSILLLLAAICLYPLYDARKSTLQLPVYRERAGTWDVRQASIQADLGQGLTEVNLREEQTRSFDEFSGLMEIGSDAEYWVNQCAAGFFGLDALTINRP